MYVRVDETAWPPAWWLYEWRSGVLSRLADLGYQQKESLRTAGNWAVYKALSDRQIVELWRRDVVADTSEIVASNNLEPNRAGAVAPNGDVAYSDSSNVFRWRDGVSQALTNDSLTTRGSVETDGVNVAYKRGPGIAVNDGMTETILAESYVPDRTGNTKEAYALAGGFIGYTKQNAVLNYQVWRHTPAGDEQLTFFASDSALDAIAPDGTILLTNAGRRYRAAPGAALEHIGSSLGRVIVADGQFLVIIDHTVLALVN
jgi:hypothetical protein